MLRLTVSTSVLMFVTSFALTATTAPAPPPSPSASVKPPKEPVAPRVPDCKPDAYGKLRCPSPPGPSIGSPCKTAKGADGIYVNPQSGGGLVCGTTGDACSTVAGLPGKVWGTTPTTFTCAGKGEACPVSGGAGRVFQVGADLSCLKLGDSCPCTTASTGCKVMGYANNYQSLECAEKDIICPASAVATVVMAPSNGKGVPLPVTASTSPFGSVQTDASSLICNYVMNGTTGQTADYTVPCHSAYRTNERAWYTCLDGDGKRQNYRCEISAPAGATVAPAAFPSLGGGVTISTPQVVTTFLTANNDAAHENAYCQFMVNTVSFTVKSACKTPKKIGTAGAYRCY